jgi:hypothetical protein
MRMKVFGALLVLSLFGIAWAGKGKLDGKTYKVTITEPDKKSYPDTLSFKNGTFDSSECQKYGFKPANYAGDGASFTATAKSEKEGTTEWSGTIKGDAIEGKLVWTKTGQPSYTYTFSGAAQK